MAASANVRRGFASMGSYPPMVAEHQVLGSTHIYAGTAVTLDTNGFARPLNTSDTNFAGFALDNEVDNSGGSAGDLTVRVTQQGVVVVALSELGGDDDEGDVGKLVYMSDDNTFTLTASTNIAIGRVVQYDPAAGTLHVFFQSHFVRSAIDAIA